MANPIHINGIPEGSQVSNYLYPDLDLAERHQDLITIVLPTGYSIYVGWFPEYDKNGEYWIRASWENGEINPIKVRSISEVQQCVSLLADYYSQSNVARSGSTSVHADFALN